MYWNSDKKKKVLIDKEETTAFYINRMSCIKFETVNSGCMCGRKSVKFVSVTAKNIQSF